MGGVQQLFPLQMTFVGINEGQILSNAVAIATVGYQYAFFGNFLAIGRVNTGVYNFEDLWLQSASQNTEWITGFSAGIGYNSGSMPMELTAMYSPVMNMVYPNIKIGFIF